MLVPKVKPSVKGAFVVEISGGKLWLALPMIFDDGQT